MVEIIEYDSLYDEQIKDLFVELQEYIEKIDQEKYNIITSDFREKYFERTLEQIKKYEGKMFLAKEDNKILGVIVGVIHNEEENTFEFKVPKRGKIVDVVVTKNKWSSGIGTMLLDKMEEYFKNIGCRGVLLDVFAYNESAKRLYKKRGYFDRNIEMMKKL